MCGASSGIRLRGTLRFVGGLLGHWFVWTKAAVDLLERCRAVWGASQVRGDLLALDSAVTDCNAAFSAVANDFRGVIAGCPEVLRCRGLLEGRWCLDLDEDLIGFRIMPLNLPRPPEK